MSERQIFDAAEAPQNCPRCEVLIFVPGLGSMIDVTSVETRMSRYVCRVCKHAWFVRWPADGMFVASAETK